MSPAPEPPEQQLLTVVYTGEPDVVYEYRQDGERRSFGRDDDCEIVIWSAVNGNRLSAVAGLIWRMDDELWLRNLSTAHDLFVEVAGLPPEPPLPPRRDESDRGSARSIPGELAYVRGPDGCELRVRQLRPPRVTDHPAVVGQTARVPVVPVELKPVALALCEPLFHGSQLPASYAQIGVRTGISSRKAVRNLVERLTALYLSELPALEGLVDARLQREADQLGLNAVPRVHRGVVRFDPPDAELVDPAELERRSALAMPTYYEVAHLLVRHHLVNEAELAELNPSAEPAARNDRSP